ncbi:MAG: prolyl oligopeptidase family serine peptidase [Candidatus Acidiferrales bacterium]
MTSIRLVLRKSLRSFSAGIVSPVVLLALFSLVRLTVRAQNSSPSQDTDKTAEAVMAPNENLVVEGIPPIPASLAEKADRYTNFRAALFASWHPTRREMLIATRFGDTFQIHSVKMPGGARTQLTFYRDNVRMAYFPPKGGDSFVFSKDIGGGEFYQLYRYDLASGAVTLLTDGKSRNTDEVWSNDGKLLAYGSTQRTGNDVDIWLSEPKNPNETKTNRMLAQLSGGGWTPLDWSPDDKQLLVMESISANESYLWRMDTASGEKTLLTPKGGTEKIVYGFAKFSKDGKGIYATTDRDSEFQRLTYIDLGSKKYTYLTSDIHWDVENFDITPDGRLIAFTVNEEGLSVLHLLDAKSGDEKPAPKLPAGVISGVRWHQNGRDLAFGVSSSHSTSDAYSVDVATAKLERWTASETSGLSPETFSTAELVHWKTFDGKSISGFLYRPPGKFSGKRPVIVDIHGGPEGQFRPSFLGRYNYFINELGIAMVFPNVRGSTGYGKTFVTLDNGLLREDSYKDINSLFDWIAQQPQLDSSRIMVTGGSYGGFMTLAVATNYNDRIRCSLDVVGPSNLVTFLEHTSGYRQDLRRVEYGDERDPQMREFLERIAPANNAQKITKPLFVVQGKNDPRVPWTEAQQMVAVVRKNGTPVWYLMANDEGHGFSKKKNVDYQFYATILFIDKFLLDY